MARHLSFEQAGYEHQRIAGRYARTSTLRSRA
jgi:hypothetical protein